MAGGLGLQGAYGGKALWDDIQKMVEERQVAAKLEQDRQDAEANRAYQAGHLKVLQGQLSATEQQNLREAYDAQTRRLALGMKTPEVRGVEVTVPGTPAVPANKGWWGGLGATEAKPATPARKRLDNVDPFTGKVYSSIDQGPVKEPADKSTQLHAGMNPNPVTGKLERAWGLFDPDTKQVTDQAGNPMPHFQPTEPQGPQPRDPGIQQMRDFQITTTLQNQYDKLAAPLRSITSTTNRMEGAWNVAKRDPNARAQAAEAMQVLFQRALDDNAVREGEFMRSLLTQSMEARLTGWIARLANGGTGVDDAGMENMLVVARSFKDAIGKDFAKLRQRTVNTAQRYLPGVAPSDILGEDWVPDEGSKPGPAGTGGGAGAAGAGRGAVASPPGTLNMRSKFKVTAPNGKVYEFDTQEAADRAKKGFDEARAKAGGER